MTRTLNIVCGIAVILTSLHLVHAIEHFHHIAMQESMNGPLYWGGMVFAVIVDFLSLIGGLLLLTKKESGAKQA